MFTAPGYALFTDLLTGWVLTPGRRTITRMLTVADPQGRRAHDAYHRFIRAGAWDMTMLWRALAVHAIERFHPDAVVVLDADDTVYKKTGRKVNGAGVFRDAVRSTRNRVVYAWGSTWWSSPCASPRPGVAAHSGCRSTCGSTARADRPPWHWPPR